jgi:predicted secreted Zn-dependent protease
MQMRKQLATAKIIWILFCAILLVACEAPATPRGSTPKPRHTPISTVVESSRSIPTATKMPKQINTQTPKPISSGMVSITHNIKHSTYDVVGVTSIDISDSMEANSPECALDEGPSDYYAEGCFSLENSSSKTSLDIKELSNGACIVNELHLHYNLEIILPKHLYPNSMNQTIQALWKNKVQSVASHEQVHLDIALEQLNKLKTTLAEALYDRSDECNELSRVLENILDKFISTYNQSQKKFDDTESRKCDSKTNRFEAKIDDLRSELDDLEVSMSSYENQTINLDAQIESNEQNIETHEIKLKEYKRWLSEAEDLLDEYYNRRQKDAYDNLFEKYNSTFSTYEGVFVQYENLLDLHARLTQQYNSILSKHNNTLDIYNSKYKQYSDLFDEYLWICDIHIAMTE